MGIFRQATANLHVLSRRRPKATNNFRLGDPLHSIRFLQPMFFFFFSLSISTSQWPFLLRGSGFLEASQCGGMNVRFGMLQTLE